MKSPAATEAALTPDPARLMPRQEFGIVLIYILGASLWIIYSDMALAWLTRNRHWSLELQTYKGLNFVATTALLLYIVLRRSFNRWRRAERKLREIEERFEFAGRAATDAIWDWNLATDALWVSDSFYQLFGYTREEIEPNTSAVICRVHPEDKDRWMKTILQAIESGAQKWNVDYRFQRKDGSYAFVEGRGYVVRDETGRARTNWSAPAVSCAPSPPASSPCARTSAPASPAKSTMTWARP
jgi:PAS domain S-box-containing protein